MGRQALPRSQHHNPCHFVKTGLSRHRPPPAPPIFQCWVAHASHFCFPSYPLGCLRNHAHNIETEGVRGMAAPFVHMLANLLAAFLQPPSHFHFPPTNASKGRTYIFFLQLCLIVVCLCKWSDSAPVDSRRQPSPYYQCFGTVWCDSSA